MGLASHAMIGVLLGLVRRRWVGPTLGAATVLAAQGREFGSAPAVMAASGLGIGADA